MGIFDASQSTSAGGSQNQSFGYTLGGLASQIAQEQAKIANEYALENWKRTAEYNSAEAQKNRDWQEKMSNTSYQRAMADMKAAGLNPILAAGNGGANTGAGAMGQIGTPDTFVASTYPDSQNGSYGSSWNSAQMTSGLATALESMGVALAGAMGSIASGSQFAGLASALEALAGTFSKDGSESTGLPGLKGYTELNPITKGLLEKGANTTKKAGDKAVNNANKQKYKDNPYVSRYVYRY